MNHAVSFHLLTNCLFNNFYRLGKHSIGASAAVPFFQEHLMAIAVADYRWNDAGGKVQVQVPLKGVHHRYLDVFHTNRYVKLNFTPYYFELFLPHEIRVTYPAPDSLTGE